jgi:hypothetical protein
MPDDEAPDELTQIRAALAERDRELAAATARAQALEDSYQAFGHAQQAANQAPQPAPGKRYAVPPNIRQQILSAGITEQELDHNGDLIIPFINAYLGQAANEVLAIIQQQADTISQFEMLRDSETYPHADALWKEMGKIRQAELKAGRYINPETAYRLAVANNYEKLAGSQSSGEGQFDRGSPAPPPSPAAARSRDASAGNIFRTVRAPTTAPEKPVTRGDDLMEMTREERRAFFEQNATTPIR